MSSKLSIDALQEVIDLLRHNSDLRSEFLDALQPGQFVQRDEMTALLEEIKQLREENAQRFELSERRFTALQEQIDKRFESMDKRFEAILQQMDKRFESMDKRFEAIQEQMDKRFESMDKRFEAILQQMNKGFEAIYQQSDRHFDKLLQQLKKTNESIRFYLDVQMNELTGQCEYRVKAALKKLGEEILAAKGFDPTQLKHLRVMDKSGTVFGRLGYVTDVNLFYHNEETWLIEILARPSESDLIKLWLAKRLLEKDYKLSISRLILICLFISEEVAEMVETSDIELWNATREYPELIPPPFP